MFVDDIFFSGTDIVALVAALRSRRDGHWKVIYAFFYLFFFCVFEIHLFLFLFSILAMKQMKNTNKEE